MIRFLLVLTFFFCCKISNGQNKTAIQGKIDAIYTSNESNEEKIAQMQAFINQEKQVLDTVTLSKAYHKLGLLYNRGNANKAAIASTEKAIKLRSSVASVDYYSLNNSLYNLCFYYGKSGNKIKRKETLQKLIKQPSKNKFTYKAYIDLAYITSENGDYYKALAYLKNVIDSFDTYNDTKTLLLAHKASIYVYSESDETKRNIAIVNNHKAEIDKLVLSHGYAKDPAVHNNLGNIYEDTTFKEKAIEEYQQALAIYVSRNDSLNTGLLYNNIGTVYSMLKDKKQADSYFNKALKSTKSKIVTAAVYNNKGYFLEEDKIPYYEKAINILLDTHYKNELPNFLEIQKSASQLKVLNNLVCMFQTITENYESNKDVHILNKVIALSVLIDKLISSIRLESGVALSKLFWIRKAADFYMSAVKICYFKNDVDQAFYFMEKNKSLLLLENLKKQDTTIINSLAIVSLKQAVKNHVTSKRNMVAYILNDEEGYGIFCDANEKLFFKLPEVPKLQIELDILKSKMTQYFVSKESKSSYTIGANSVFKKVFPFKNAIKKLRDKQLLIIPDYKLQYINFEALITDTIEERYLFDAVEISYFLSASVSNQLNIKKKKKRHDKILGLAPVNFQIEGLLPLERSEKVMEAIASVYPSDIYLKEAATKKLFTEKVQEYGIIHVNSHAGIDTDTYEPWLAFYQDKIDLKELSDVSNEAALVVLDACKGASGKQEIGEGIMSLARGFFRGGANSVITNQWNANEKATNEILIDFYKELKKGNTKSKALYNAKKTYLATHQLSEISPYYWASLVLIGDYNAIENSNEMNYTWIYIGCFLLVLFLAFLKKKSKRVVS